MQADSCLHDLVHCSDVGADRSPEHSPSCRKDAKSILDRPSGSRQAVVEHSLGHWRVSSANSPDRPSLFFSGDRYAVESCDGTTSSLLDTLQAITATPLVH